MNLENQDKPGRDTLAGTGVAWAKFVLLKLGFDATADDANAWLPPMGSETDTDDVTEDQLAEARRQLEAGDTGQRFLSKREILATQFEIHFLTPEGQEIIREAVRDRKLPKDVVAKILDA